MNQWVWVPGSSVAACSEIDYRSDKSGEHCGNSMAAEGIIIRRKEIALKKSTAQTEKLASLQDREAREERREYIRGHVMCDYSS